MQEFVFQKLNDLHKRKAEVFEIDHIIHVYHKQSQELFKFINTYHTRNSMLSILTEAIKEEEKGIWKWEPETKQKQEKNEQ